MKKKVKLVIIIVLIIVISNGIINGYRVVETDYNLESNKVDQDYTFVQISDYHSNSGKDDQILKLVENSKPDYILLSGDILDNSDMEPTINFIKQLTDITQVVYARGNHDDDYQSYTAFKAELEKLGVIVLTDTNYQIGDINFVGIEDWTGANLFPTEHFSTEYTKYIDRYSSQIDSSEYNVLLAHRPDFLQAYSGLNADLVVSGHAHGGQWQIPFTDIGLIAPDEGLFPTHVHGLKTMDGTTQIISSGISNPYAPVPRLFNPEEVVVINVKPA